MTETSLTDSLGNKIQKRGALNILRALTACAFLAALVYIAQPTRLGMILGLPCLALGLLFRVWAAGHLIKTKELSTSGPYRHVQHPLYFGRLALGTGFCFIAWREQVIGGATIPLNLVLLGLFWLVFFGYYIPRKKRVEGSRLLKIHGQPYADWTAHVPLVIPRLTPWGEQKQHWSKAKFDELGEIWTVLAVVAAALLILVQVK
ncbi:MAG: hypothetical protein H6825_03245 [Planctomycetes bacterium]|nr:hypothetical protein [Planctomycetota bacterium]